MSATAARPGIRASLDAWRIALAFFLSGFAALVYQVAWQRLLFTVVGVDIESVTIVVSTFMLGLGAGALVGGFVADLFPRRILVAFCASELGIAAFGFVSVDLILAARDVFSSLPPSLGAGLSFLMLLIPTVCMGATLPMLVAHAFQTSGNIGVSTGTLYFVNTVGAAAGALSVGFLFFYWLDIRATVYAAVSMNILSGAIVATAIGRR